MTERYNQQTGGPAIQPDSGEIVSDPNGDHPAVVGERSTVEGRAGQGLGQMSDADNEAAKTGDSGTVAGEQTPSDRA